MPRLAAMAVDWVTLAAGTGVGILFKWGADMLTDRVRNARQDVVWRREKLVSAAGDLLQVATELVRASDNVGLAVSTYVAEKGSNGAAAARDAVDQAHQVRRPLLPQTDRAYEVFALFAKDQTVALATRFVELAKQAPTDDNYAELRAQLDQARAALVEQIRFETSSVAPRRRPGRVVTGN
jgi:hypothetical protein